MLTAPEYQGYVLKDYPFWTLFLHKKQWPYVGRCYAWWKDRKPGEGEGMPPGLIPKPARGWLFDQIFWEVARACGALGYTTSPYGERFLLNMCCLMNEPVHNHHMHWHFIPRSAHSIVLEAIDLRCEDTEWGRNYAKPPLGEQELDEPRLQHIRTRMIDAL